MDDLLDDDKDLFGGLKDDKEAVPSAKEERESKAATASGGLFDDFDLDNQSSNANGHKGTCTCI